jgi:hypothetical protein
MRMIKSRRISWAGYAAQSGEKRRVYRVLIGKREDEDHYEDKDTDGSIIIK